MFYSVVCEPQGCGVLIWGGDGIVKGESHSIYADAEAYPLRDLCPRFVQPTTSRDRDSLGHVPDRAL